jgi:hypothetical protein
MTASHAVFARLGTHSEFNVFSFGMVFALFIERTAFLGVGGKDTSNPLFDCSPKSSPKGSMDGA